MPSMAQVFAASLKHGDPAGLAQTIKARLERLIALRPRQNIAYFVVGNCLPNATMEILRRLMGAQGYTIEAQSDVSATSVTWMLSLTYIPTADGDVDPDGVLERRP